MTKVTIDIRNIASSTHADDRVLFRSPIHRTGGAGLVSTANEVVTLTDGVGDVELIPGPVIVTFQCKGVTDISPKRGTVPDTGPVTLGQVISGSFSYSPEVVTAAQAARNGAVEAAGQAKDYRDQAATSASNAATSASQAASSLRGAQDLAADVSDDVAQAISSRDQAVQAASDASTSASQAATARDQAVQAATDTSGALDARIPAGLALRLDTSVGTRIFAGDTMIFGDTGWIHADTLMTTNFTLWNSVGDPPPAPNTNTFLRLKRVGNKVTLDARIAASSVIAGTSRTGTKFLSDSIPVFGFRPHRDYILAGQYWCYATGERGVVRVHGGNIEMRESTGVWKQGELVIVHATWETESQWPTSLPGLPA